MCFCFGCGIYERALSHRRYSDQAELDQENGFRGVHGLPFPVSGGSVSVSGTRGAGSGTRISACPGSCVWVDPPPALCFFIYCSACNGACAVFTSRDRNVSWTPPIKTRLEIWDRREGMWYTDSRAGGLWEQICRAVRVLTETPCAQYLKGRENHGTSDQNECSGSVQSFMTGESGTERIKGIVSGRNTA